jgi:CRISPR-associated endonuclease Cas2
MKKAHYIITYDIIDSKRLKKVAKFLEKRALRFQFSAFYIFTDSKTIFFITKEIKKIITKEDDVRIYKVNLKKSLVIRGIEFDKFIV